MHVGAERSQPVRVPHLLVLSHPGDPGKPPFPHPPPHQPFLPLAHAQTVPPLLLAGP